MSELTDSQKDLYACNQPITIFIARQLVIVFTGIGQRMNGRTRVVSQKSARPFSCAETNGHPYLIADYLSNRRFQRNEIHPVFVNSAVG
jgi:hypothetical protein